MPRSVLARRAQRGRSFGDLRAALERPTTSIEAAVGTSLRHTDGELPDVNGRCAPPSGLEPAAWIAIESRPALA